MGQARTHPSQVQRAGRGRRDAALHCRTSWLGLARIGGSDAQPGLVCRNLQARVVGPPPHLPCISTCACERPLCRRGARRV